MTLRVDRRKFLMGSTALLAAGAMSSTARAQAEALRLYWWGGQTRADRKPDDSEQANRRPQDETLRARKTAAA